MSKLDEYKVGKRIELGDGSAIVLLDMLGAPKTAPQADVEQNIYRIDRQGNIMWRIAAGAPVYPRDPFTGVGFDEKKRLMAYRFDGGQYQIDVETGVARPVQLAR
jgi:hypothetical protein